MLKSAAQSGNIMTRCLIRSDFFHENTFKIVLNKAEDIAAAQDPESGHENKTLIEFCLPFTELKHIVEGMCEDENPIELAYPRGDNMLEIRILEESKGTQDKLIIDSSIQLETYEATHSLDADYSFKSVPIAATIFARVLHFKRALREFSFLDSQDVISMEMSENYPKMQFVFSQPTHRRYHAVKFNEEIDDFVIKQISQSKAYFKIESLRLAFTRMTSDSLLCIVTLNTQGALSVKIMHDTKSFLAESLILCQEDESEIDEGTAQ